MPRARAGVKRDYRVWRSPVLEREMEVLVFGDRGTPVVVFPTSMGRFYQWEDTGMIAHLTERIEDGLLQLWCADSVDGESFYDTAVPATNRAVRHLAYDRYLTEELLPLARLEAGGAELVLAGASFGAFHAATLALRHPGIARAAICLSGAFDAARWLDGSREGDAYFVNPLAFLPALEDPVLLGPLRRTEFVVATGLEDPNVDESRRLAAALRAKQIPAALHLWDGWAHDWPYWKEMVDTYL
ncbi:MAG TPA: alpha/beta hydrolase-fold protein [Candidatus Saccharimonadales bacterium]|nr:alpha/beta hydrolase-fold protein [Candidatus Saccharimonadales bacterium]